MSTQTLVIKGIVSDLPTGTQAKVKRAAKRLRAIVNGSPEAQIALSIVAAELADSVPADALKPQTAK